jgi:hypothetical protein
MMMNNYTHHRSHVVMQEKGNDNKQHICSSLFSYGYVRTREVQ